MVADELQVLMCEGCQLERWPPPLFHASAWPRTASFLKTQDVHGELRGRSNFSQPRGLVCSCTEEEREHGRLELAAEVGDLHEAAARQVTHGADPLQATMADTLIGALKDAIVEQDAIALKVVDDPLDEDAKHSIAVTIDLALGSLDNLLRQCCRPWALIWHCLDAGALDPLILLWSTIQSKGGTDVAADCCQTVAQLLNWADVPLDGLHWVGYACLQSVGAPLTQELLALIAGHLRAPLAGDSNCLGPSL